MRSSFIFLAILLLSLSSLSAQEIRYRDAKKQYSWKEYHKKQENPKYKPWVAGMASFMVAGAGQMYADEVGRGLYFFGGQVVCSGMLLTGVYMGTADLLGDKNYDEDTYRTLALSGYLGLAVLTIWSTVDAIHIAKVKNYAHAKILQSNSSFRLQPSIHFLSTLEGTATSNLGARICLNF